MPQIDVSIANLATGFFGEDDQISSPDDESKPARTVRAAWDEVRKFVRSKADWSCGKRRSQLNARAADSDFALIGYDYAFPLPDRFARLVSILDPPGCREDYRVMRGPSGRELWCDTLGPLEIEWQEDVEDPALWSFEFREAFTYRLAWQIADRLSGDKQRKEQALEAYRAVLAEGRNSDARQQPPRQFGASDWSRSRRDGGGSMLAAGEH